MALLSLHCPNCHSDNCKTHTCYEVSYGEDRNIYHCKECGNYFSETKNTPLEGLKTPLSKISDVLEAINDGMSINAASRRFKTTRKSINRWTSLLGKLTEVLLLYALCHQFLEMIIEGDEFYTKVDKNKPPSESEGWTIILMDRASRFIWELRCGEHDSFLFENAIETLADIIEQTGDLSLVTDGERRYGNRLFEICQEVVRNGSVGRPKTTLKEGVKVRIKNKGSQAHKTGPSLPKYQAPQPEHPQTLISLEDKEIHANHVEALNSSLRRRLSCYRRKTNTYAKNILPLQRRLDAYWVLHNFVWPHFTLKEVPAVALGIQMTGLSWFKLFRIPFFSPPIGTTS
jgi:transposase-like protein